LIEVLETIEQPKSPFAAPLPRAARLVQPRLVADVQRLSGADALRHAVLRGVRVGE
jgi:hypothetical protein